MSGDNGACRVFIMLANAVTMTSSALKVEKALFGCFSQPRRISRYEFRLKPIVLGSASRSGRDGFALLMTRDETSAP